MSNILIMVVCIFVEKSYIKKLEGERMISKMFNNTSILEKAVDASWLRNEAIANNLANVDTPGYKRQDVAFENFLTEALEQKKVSGNRTHEKHIPIGLKDVNNIPIQLKEDAKGNTMRIDKNNVDIDAEMALLSKNNIYYNAVVQQLSNKLSSVRNTIRDIK